MSKIKKLSMLQTRAAVTTSSIDKENRTVEVVFGTDTPVRMYNWDIGRYMEILSFDPAHVRMDRINSGAPLLKMHRKDEQIGVVESARIENGKGVAVIRFSKNKDADEVWNDVVDGIVRNISVGYNVFEYLDQTASESDTTTLKAIDWEPSEISIVSIPADIESGVRSEESENDHEVKISQLNKSRKMETEEEKQARLAAEAKAKTDAEAKRKADDEAAEARTRGAGSESEAEKFERIRQAAIAGEKSRVSEITQMTRMANLPAEFAQTLIDNNTSAEKARKMIFDEFEKADPNKGSNNISLAGKADEIDKRREAMSNAQLLRAFPDAERLKILTPDQVSAAREYRSDKLFDMVRMSLDNLGIKHRGMDSMEMVRLAITSSGSDLPVLLSGLNRQILLRSYSAIADTWRNIVKVGSVSDFRDWRRLRMGTLGNLDDIGENGEFKMKKISDADYEKVSLTTKGNLLNISRQMIINDDLNGIAQYADQLGRASARTIESAFYAQFALNSGNGPLMVDGVALFDAAHGNIATTAAAPSTASFDAIRTQMKSIKDKDGNDYLDIQPSIWLGPSALKGAADLINRSQYEVGTNRNNTTPNISAALFDKIIDTPRLSGTAWYAFADPGAEPVFEIVFLNGQESPHLESQMGYEVDGMSWKIRHDWGIAPIGYRGVIKNAGV